jgi:hypothetical protein
MVAARTKEANHFKVWHGLSTSAGMAEGTLDAWFYLILMG